MTRAGLAVLSFLAAAPASAQFSGLSRTEIQVGNTPFTEPATLTTGFEQLNLRYNAYPIRLAVRAESFATNNPDTRYVTVSQFRASGRWRGFEAAAGHFYEIIGRGLLLRGFEIPGATYEDAGFRVRQSFQRDIQGARLGWSNRHVDVTALRGKPLVSVLPPTVDRSDRRPDLVTAAEAGVRVRGTRLGAAFLRNEATVGDADYGSFSLDTGFGALGAYAELATHLGNPPEERPHAYYGSITYARIGFGLSLEYKDYQNFFLGSGFNDPPSLIREHSWVLLNRATHVLNAVSETGFQVEAYGSLPGGAALTANATRAVNDFGLELTFREYYLEYSSDPTGRTSFRVFGDYAQDDLKGQEDRIALGTYVDRKLSGRWSVSMQLEAQQFQQAFIDEAEAYNLASTITVSKSTRWSAGIVAERSTDPLLTDDPRTPEVEEEARHWLGLNLGWRPNRRHTLSLFTGTRRGGPACTSGICYEVLDFEGAEFRLTTRF